MSEFSQYLLAIVFASLLCGICRAASPEGTPKKAVAFAASLILILTIALPLRSLVKKADEIGTFALIPSGDDAAYASFSEKTLTEILEKSGSQISEKLKKQLCSKFSLDGDDFDIEVHMTESGGELIADYAVLTLRGALIARPVADIEKYVSETAGCALKLAQ